MLVLGGSPVSQARADGTGPGIQERVGRAFERSEVPGMVAVVVHGDQVVWAGGVGTASDGTAMTADSLVQVGSVTKSFTATAVLGLVEDGAITLDGSVAAQLPELSMDDARVRQVTVRQLLTHTSGLTDADTHFFGSIHDGASTPRGVVATLADHHLTTQPGTTYRYANINYVLAGRLVEVVTGRSISEQLDQRVLGPLGLRDTALDWDAAPSGHTSVFGVWFGRRDTSSRFNHDPAGALVTTANDLGRWLMASNGHGPTPLPASVRTQLETTTPASGSYGAGWARDEHLEGWWNHGGNRYTYSAAMLRDPDDGWGVAVVVNGASMNDPAYAVARELAALVEGGEPVTVPSAVAWDRWALLVAAAALALGTVGVLRSRGWARRHPGRSRRTVFGLVWLLPAIAVALLLPPIADRLVGGVDMSWSMLTYYSLSPLLTVITIALACAAVLITRLTALRQRT